MTAGAARGPQLRVWYAVVGIVHAAIFLPGAFRALYRTESFVGPNLFLHHTWFSTFAFEDPWRPATPVYLFLLVARLGNEAVSSTDPRFGALVAAGAFYALFGIAAFEVLRERRPTALGLAPPAAAVASVAVAMLESPTALLGWDRYTTDGIFLPLYLPFAPTTLGSLGLNLLLLLKVSDLLDGQLPASKRWQVPALIVAATVAKPTLSPLLLIVVTTGLALSTCCPRMSPTARAATTADGPRSPSTGQVALLTIVPWLLVLIPQYVATSRWVRYPLEGFDDRGGWQLNPLQELADLNALTVWFWAALLFPLAAVVLLRTRLLRDTPSRLGLLSLGLGVGLALLLERTGTSDWKGDMLQLPGAALAVLMVFVPRRMVELWRTEDTGRASLVVLWAVLIPYLVAGVLSWSCRNGWSCVAL